MLNEKICQVAIGLAPGVGSILTKHLISYCGSATEVFKCTKGKLIKIPGIGPVTAEAVLRTNNLQEAEKECERAEKENVQLLFYTDKDYPDRLKSIADAPSLLYYRGNTDLNPEKVVAIVGTRRATSYGKGVTEDIVSELARYKSILVLSGLAYGIDVAAHKAAVKYTVPTVGVMASGIDIVYPASHQSVAQQMEEQGGLLTEYRFGTKPDAPKFPARNRIIAGMADALIVVEAAHTGGALITAEIADSYNRDVFAVPGNLKSTYSEGCNRLIRAHKATIFTGVQDLEYFMNWHESTPKKTEPLPLPDFSACSPDEQQILRVLQGRKEILIDDLSFQAQMPVGKTASLLLSLELQGIVKALPGKKFALNE